MVCARVLRTFVVFTIVTFFSVVVAAGQQKNSNCNWYCWVEQKIAALSAQIDELYAMLQQQQKLKSTDAVQIHPGDERSSSTPSPYPSPFGTPYVTEDSYPVSTPIVTVSPTDSKSPPLSTSGPDTKPDVEDRDGYRAVGYFGNWDIYARKYFPQQIPATKLTHLLYAFADNQADGTITLSDSYADTEIHYQGDSWSDNGTNVYGAMKQLNLLKRQNRNLKVMLSIGGWTYTNERKHMDPVGSSQAARTAFAQNCVSMIKSYGFDGIDVDWEYPQSPTQGSQFLLLLKAIRAALDAYANTLAQDTPTYAKATRPHFLLSIAAPAGATNYQNLPLADMADVLDFVNLMAYDYAGSWDNTTGHASNLLPSTSNPLSTPYNTESVVQHYTSLMPASKINLGMPLYGRAFTNTAGLGQPYEGVGKGSWEAGVYDFKDLPLQGATEYWDQEAYATYSYDNATGMLVSYDTVDMALTKVDYVRKRGLGGAMWWEVSGDRTGEGSLIGNVVRELAGRDGMGMESRANWLYYPDSEYDNIKSGLAGS